MKIHIVQGRHWAIPGTPATAHFDIGSANVAAIDLLNLLGADSADYDGQWEPVDRDADAKTWRGALRELQAQRVHYITGEGSATVAQILASFSDDDLDGESECSVWIDTLDIAQPAVDVWAHPVTLGTMTAYRDLADKARNLIDATGGDAPEFLRVELVALESATVACENADPRS